MSDPELSRQLVLAKLDANAELFRLISETTFGIRLEEFIFAAGAIALLVTQRAAFESLPRGVRLLVYVVFGVLMLKSVTTLFAMVIAIKNLHESNVIFLTFLKPHVAREIMVELLQSSADRCFSFIVSAGHAAIPSIFAITCLIALAWHIEWTIGSKAVNAEPPSGRDKGADKGTDANAVAEGLDDT